MIEPNIPGDMLDDKLYKVLVTLWMRKKSYQVNLPLWGAKRKLIKSSHRRAEARNTLQGRRIFDR